MKIKLNGEYSLDEIMKIIRENAPSYETTPANTISGAKFARNYCKAAISGEEREVFGVLFLDNKHRIIKFEILFTGTINAATVYPREIAKQALKHNAAALIITHNHPSGEPNPSSADDRITTLIKNALEILDINLLDHIIVGNASTEETYSYTEAGRL